MKKKLIEGVELLPAVPPCSAQGPRPVVRLQQGLTLTDRVFESPLLLLGGVGTGKTTLLTQLMDDVLAEAERTGDHVVIFCAKPDMFRYRRPGDPLISITSREPGSMWNLFLDSRDSHDPKLRLREISTNIFAEAKAKTNQIFFPIAAQDIFYQTCLYLYDYGQRAGVPISNKDLVDFLITTPLHSTPDVPGWAELPELQPAYFSCVRDYLGDGTSDQSLGVLSELRAQIGQTLYGSFAGQGKFSTVKALKTDGSRIFLHYDYANAGQSTLSVLKLILDLLLREAMQPGAKHKTWFFFDEGSQLPRSDVMMDALSLGRDPGNTGRGGVRICMAIQSAKLMTRHYSPTEAETLLSLFPNVISLRVSDPESRKVLSARYGKAHYLYSFIGHGDREHQEHSHEVVLSDYQFAKLQERGQAIMSLPAISPSPFFYDGYQKQKEEWT